jgi:hypothetical protein
MLVCVMTGLRTAAVLALLSVCGANAVAAAPALPEGSKTIALISASGEKLEIGHIIFTREAEAATFVIALDAPQFAEEFLSMRPFPCLAGVKETWCHLAYPYDLARRVSAADLTDLEYALLFLFKPPAGYGIDPWNGLYFKLALADDGTISGAVHDVNLDPLGVPPADRAARLIQASDLTPSDPATHRFARIEIR